MTGAVTVRDLDRNGVRLIAPDDPRFEDLARPLIGSRADRILQMKPGLVIVENAAPRTAVAISLTWRFTKNAGGSTERTNSVFPHVICGDQLIARRRPGVRPGERHLVAARCVVEGLDDVHEDDRWIEDFVRQAHQSASGATDIIIELDAVIFDDGTLVGPDGDGWLSDLFGTYVAEKQHWYRAIIDGLDAGASVEEAYAPLRAFSAETRSRMMPGTGGNRVDMRKMIWKIQAAGEAHGWRARYPDAEIPELLKTIRLEPFVIARVNPA